MSISEITTISQARKIYENSSSGDEVKKLALDKWIELSSKEIESVYTIDQAKEAYKNAFGNGKTDILALEKWASLCTTVTQIRDAYYRAYALGNESIFARQKWSQISLRDIRNADTIMQAQEACINAPLDEVVRTVARQKLAELVMK